MGRDAVDRRKDRLHGRDVVLLDTVSRVPGQPVRNAALADREGLKHLEWENAQLKRADEILRKASAFAGRWARQSPAPRAPRSCATPDFEAKYYRRQCGLAIAA